MEQNNEINKSLNPKTATMKKLQLLAPVLFILNGQSQNLIQANSLLNLSNISQVQSQQVFASNIMVNNTNKPARVNSGPQIQRAVNTVQRRQRRTNATQTNNADPAPQQLSNLNSSNINDEIQVQRQITFVENNTGNAFGNEMNPLQQLASLDIPAIQLGNRNMDLNLNLDMNMPKINLKPVKFSGKGFSNSKGSNHTLLNLKKKLVKFNRKTSGKLSFRKKLKIKVDDCFKW